MAVAVALVTLMPLLVPIVLAHLLTAPLMMTMMFPRLLLVVWLISGINLLVVLFILLLVGWQWRVYKLSYWRAVLGLILGLILRLILRVVLRLILLFAVLPVC